MRLEICAGTGAESNDATFDAGQPVSSPLAMNTRKHLATSNVLIPKAQHQKWEALIGQGTAPSS